MDQIWRDGVWWSRDLVGGWLRFNAATGQWESSMLSPPPPPPPPPGYVAPLLSSDDMLSESVSSDGDFPYDSSIYVPLPKKSKAGQWRELIARFDPRMAVAGGVMLALLLFGGVGWAVLGDSGAAPTSAVGASLAGGKLTPKQRFIREADGLCADVITAQQKISATPTTLAEVTENMQKLRGIIERAIERGHAIKAPRKLRDGWKRFVGGRGQLEVIDQMMAAVASGDLATVQRIEAEVNKEAARERRWAKRAGLKVCSQEL